MVSLHAALALIVCSATGQTVLLDFYSDHCPPCRQMDPVVQQIAAKGYPVERINTANDPAALAKRFNVTSIPCFVMVADGREVDRVVGVASLERLEHMCKAGVARGQNIALAGGTHPRTDVVVPATRVVPAARSAAPPDVFLADSRGADRTSLADHSSVPLGDTSPADDALLSATVRLRVRDPRGASKGTGTIIDAREGEALVLTCAHLFRDSKGPIEVELFGSSVGERVAGELLVYDLNSDVALLRMPATGPVKAARVAPRGYRVGPGDRAIGLGCNHGSDPTIVRTRVTAVDRYKDWPNLTVAGESVEGRSGGGLFTEDGMVIGVCNARDPQLREGLFSSLPAIHAIIDRKGLSFVYSDATLADSEPAPAPLTPIEPLPMTRGGPEPGLPTSNEAATGSAMALADLSPRGPDPREQAALEEIRRRLQEGAEVICVVRSRKDPTAPSEVIVLDKVSPEFFQGLYAEARSGDGNPRSAPMNPVSGTRTPSSPIMSAMRGR